MVRRRAARASDHEEAAPVRQVGKAREVAGGGVRARRAVVVADLHAERLGAPCHRGTDRAEPEDAEPRARERVAERVPARLPSALADEAVGAAEVTRQRDDEADRDVRHVGGEHARGGRDGDAAPRQFFHVDAVGPGPEAGDDREVRQPVEQRRVDRLLAVRRDAADAGAGRRVIQGEALPQPGDDRLGQGADLKHPGFSRHLGPPDPRPDDRQIPGAI